MAAMALTWQKVAPGVWRGRAGQDGQPQLLAAAGVAPRSEGLAQLGEAECPLERERILAEAQAERCLLSVPLEPDEVLYGLGLNFKGGFTKSPLTSAGQGRLVNRTATAANQPAKD